MRRSTLLFPLLLTALCAASALAQTPAPLPANPTADAVDPTPGCAGFCDTDRISLPSRLGRGVQFGVQLQNLVVLRSDTDFDPTAPAWNPDGQTSGAHATVLQPTITWHAARDLRIYYETEVGLNYWSKSDPNQEDMTAPSAFVLKQRQIFAEGELGDEDDWGFRVGYQYLSDPTGLFLGHWLGAAGLWHQIDGDLRVGLVAGQVPDATYEGLTIQDNNFRHDIFVGGLRADLGLAAQDRISAGVYGLYDNSEIGRPRWLVAPAVHVRGDMGVLSGSLDGVLQVGSSANTAADGGDQTILAWAAQAHGDMDLAPFALSLNVLALSGDDGYSGNDREGAFLYSSRSSSRTVMLTEDEHRNWYDQLDRRMARFQGGFWQHDAGFAVADLTAAMQIGEGFRPALILGGAAVLEPKHALNERWTGFEADVDLGFRAGESLTAHLVGSVLLPGKAAAALVNRIDLASTEPIWSMSAMVGVGY